MKDHTKAELSRQKLEIDIVRGKLNTRLVELQQDIRILERAMGLLDEGEDMMRHYDILSLEVRRIVEREVPPPRQTIPERDFAELLKEKP